MLSTQFRKDVLGGLRQNFTFRDHIFYRSNHLFYHRAQELKILGTDLKRIHLFMEIFPSIRSISIRLHIIF